MCMIKKLFFIIFILISFNISAKEWQKDIKDILVKSEDLEYTVDLGVFHFFIEDIEEHISKKNIKFNSAEEASEVTYTLKRLILISEELIHMNGSEKDVKELKYISAILGSLATKMNFKNSYKKTNKIFLELLEEEPNNPKYNKKYALFLFNVGEEEKAIKYLKKLQNLNFGSKIIK